MTKTIIKYFQKICSLGIVKTFIKNKENVSILSAAFRNNSKFQKWTKKNKLYQFTKTCCIKFYSVQIWTLSQI